MAVYIVVGLVILFVGGIYLLFAALYFSMRMQMKNGIKAVATVLEEIGEERLATGMNGARVRRRKFYKYNVEYWNGNTNVVGEASVCKRGLQPGDTVEITYEQEQDGTTQIVSEAAYKWSREMFIGYTLGIILGVVLVICKKMGYIQ